MSELYLAQQLITTNDNLSYWTNVGIFTQHDMAMTWLNEDLDKRSIRVLPCLDKTFAQMSVEYNNEYEG